MKYNKIAIGILTIGIILLISGVSYAFFTYSRVSDKNSQLITGEVYMHYNEGVDTISLENVFPESDEIARSKPDNYITFTIDGKNTTTNKDIYYEIKLDYGEEIEGKTRFKDEDLKFDLVETVIENNVEVSKTVLNGISYEEINDTRIWVNTIPKNTTNEVVITYQLRMWISDEVIISDTESYADYTTDVYKNSYASVKVNVYGDFEEKIVTLPLYKTLDQTLTNSLLSTDDDNRILAGSAVTSNYVSYSGYLWRVVSVNNDGSVKLITEDNVTEIIWTGSTAYEDTEIYTYLNNDFLNNLENYENLLVTDYKWNATVDYSTTLESIVRPAETTIVSSPVGLLTLYEYISTDANNVKSPVSNNYYNKNERIIQLSSVDHMSRNEFEISSYLDNDDEWFLLTSHDYYGWRVGVYGSVYNHIDGTSTNSGIRPSIVLKANSMYIAGGDGSEGNPYVIYSEE